MKKKIVYTESKYNWEPNKIPMVVTYQAFRRGDGYTDLSGDWVSTGSHQVKRFEVAVPAVHRWHNPDGIEEHEYMYTLKTFEYPHDGKKNRGLYQSRLQIAINWLHKFRALNESKDYWPFCYSLEGKEKRWHDNHFCPELDIRGQAPACKIKPFSYGYCGSSNGERIVPEDRKCDLFKWGEGSIPRFVPVDPVSGFDLFDYYRCARKTELKYLHTEEAKEAL